MRVLMISADPALADKASAVFARVKGYAAEAGEIVAVLRAVGGSAAPVSDGPLAVLPTASRSKILSFFDLYRSARRAARERGPFDLVTAQDPFEHGFVARLVARAVGAPLELQAHADFAAPGFREVSAVNRLRARLAEFLIPRAAGVRAVSARVAAACRAAGAKSVSAAPVRAELGQLMSLPLPTPYAGDGTFEAVTVSRLSGEKRIGTLLEAVGLLRAAGFPARLTVIGDGPEDSALRARAAELGQGAVVFLGRLAAPLSAGRYHAYVQASAFEGYGLSLLEAAARALPIVTTDVGLVGETLVDGESCLVADGAAAFAAALRGLAESPALAASLGVAARAAAARADSSRGEAVVGAWRKIAAARPRRLLVVTQVLDEGDPVLGFFCRWVDELAARSGSVVAVGLSVGRYAPPPNVRVLSLGKENVQREGGGLSRLARKIRYAARFKLICWRERKNYDAVFVHMNPEYLAVSGVLWRLLGKRAYLWYTHRNVDLKLRLATALATGVFTASAESFRLPTSKRRVMGHGIDGARFSAEGRAWGSGVVGTAGRVSPTKRVREIVAAALAAGARARVAGGPATAADAPYDVALRELAAREPRLEMLGSIAPADVPAFLRGVDVFVNLSETGSLDKAVLEAAACGCAVVTSNPAFADAPGVVFLSDPAPERVAAAIAAALSAPPPPALREWVSRGHDLSRLADALAAAIYGGGPDRVLHSAA